MSEGEWVRSFENPGGGKDNNSQHGAAPDPFMSSSYSLRTSIAANTKQEKYFNSLMNQIEMGSNDEGEKRTREGYKDKQKEEARLVINKIIERLSLPRIISYNALGYFSKYRDIKEKVMDFDIVLGGCVIMISFFFFHFSFFFYIYYFYLLNLLYIFNKKKMKY